jgi:hypothetical protein
VIDLDELARLDLADEFRADTSKATVSLAKDDASPILPITSGRMPSGSRQAIMPSGGHADQRIGALDHAQGIDEAIEQRRVAAGCDRWMITSVSEVDWKIAPLLHQFALQGHCVGDVAVVRDR